MEDAYKKGMRSQIYMVARNPYPIGSREWDAWQHGRQDAQARAWRGDVEARVWPWVVAAVAGGIALAAVSAWFVYRVEAWFHA